MKRNEANEGCARIKLLWQIMIGDISSGLKSKTPLH